MSKRRSRGGWMELTWRDPTDDEFRRWAHDPQADENSSAQTMVYGCQDAELMLTCLERGALFVELADSDAVERMFFLRCLYLLSYDNTTSEEGRTRLGYLFHRVSPWTSKPDVVRWMERSKALVERSRSPDYSQKDELNYEDWACGDLAKR